MFISKSRHHQEEEEEAIKKRRKSKPSEEEEEVEGMMYGKKQNPFKENKYKLNFKNTRYTLVPPPPPPPPSLPSLPAVEVAHELDFKMLFF